MQLISSVKQWVNDNEEQLFDTYARLHDLAEVSWKEENTSKYLCSKLSEIGFSYQTFESHHGIVVDWKSKTKRARQSRCVRIWISMAERGRCMESEQFLRP
ncbi:hypothetical protein ACJROX_07325 [Pseudalkalibacillus sp. A8]|uniref:hypothetical protein n=1 Tax=Pseudalkalibacillus sp. A8 TaxID=3382641 RepID=UPI0038B5CFE1